MKLQIFFQYRRQVAAAAQTPGPTAEVAPPAVWPEAPLSADELLDIEKAWAELAQAATREAG
jgi:hypothetical protein